MFKKLTFTIVLFSAFIVLSQASQAWAATYYVSPSGSDSNSGTISSPFATVNKVHDRASSGDTIYLRGGVYSINSSITLSKDNLNLFAHSNEKPIFDGSKLSFGATCFRLSGANDWHLKGFEVRYCPEYGIYLSSSSNNLLEQLVVNHSGHKGNDGSGFQVVSGSKNNTFLNCDSYHNDNWSAGSPSNVHANADGFAVKHDENATGNQFIGCRSWQNADDGWDFWSGPPVTLKNCWSWENGLDEQGNHCSSYCLGDGNGYKMGRGSGGHTFINCLAWGNYQNGFDYNNSGKNLIYNNTAYSNRSKNYRFGICSDSYCPNATEKIHILKNNINYQGGYSIDSQVINEYNSWNSHTGVTVTDADFLSLSDSANRGPRQTDGNLPNSNFLKLRSDSDCVDAGTTNTPGVQIPFNGRAPDLGAFETGGTPGPTATPTTGCARSGDVNCDQKVDVIDMRLVLKAWKTGGTSQYENREDAHPDGKINLYDAAVVVGNWAP